MFILGANSAGILNKQESFYRNINLFNPIAFFLQETKTRFKNKLKHPNYTFFEYIRKHSGGGGLITAVHNNLHPVQVSNDDETEVLVVETKIGDMKLRLINGYGPQEADEESSKNFMNRIDLEVKSSKLAGALVCIEMDANSKLGPDIIKNDPKEQSRNGKLLEQIINNNNLVVVNGTNLCEGVITRQRTTIHREEKSILDFFIVCKSFFRLIKNMKVDEEKKFSLCSYSTRNGETNVKKSDHNLIYLEVNREWKTFVKKKRIEIFNFNDDDGFKKFFTETDDNPALRNAFKNENEDFETASKKWLKILNSCIFKSFKKIRVGKHKIDPYMEGLFAEKEHLMEYLARVENEDNIVAYEDTKDKLEEVNEAIARQCCEKNKKVVDEYLGKQNDAIEGFSQSKTWKLKKKLAPKNTIDPPAAKKDKWGNLVTGKEALETLYIETYRERLKSHPISKDLQDLKDLKEYLFNLRVKYASKRISEDWKIEELEKVLKSLKNGKARDPHGHVYELYKYGGNDLKNSLLKFLNLVKRTQIYPSILQASNITSFYKSKGDRANLENDRGVFIVVKLRSILDKLVYNDNYSIIDESMSCSNIGARKNRNIRDHLFVINAVINDTFKKKKSVDIEIMDIAKCFDKMWYEETGNDVFKAGVTDDKFVLLANSNKTCKVAVRTPWGSLTERITLDKIEMQGTVNAPLKASVQLDTLGKECIEAGEGLFKYKDCVNITPLIMIDDILAISSCGKDSVTLNAIIQSKIETKQLMFGPSKCSKLHIGSKCKATCPTLKVHDQEIKSVEQEKYLGDILSDDGKIDLNIQARRNKGTGYVNQILSMLKEISFGYYYFNMAMLFRTTILINGMLCSSEALHGITSAHIKQLESCDTILFKTIFSTPGSTPTAAFYLETGAVPIRFLLKGRRLMFLWNILQKDSDELVKKVYEAQKLFPTKDDFFNQIKEDCDDIGLGWNENTIKNMKKNKFKVLVQNKVRNAAHTYLIEKKEKLSKLDNLSSDYTFKDYLGCHGLSITEKQLLFKLRTRMIDVKANYPNLYKGELFCSLCDSNTIENQQHILICPSLIVHSSTKIQYTDIFSDNTEKQIEAVKHWSKVLKLRKIKLKMKETSQLRSHVH